jgi:DNA-directed RNA polymerase sigma subunit (sigma70/sigma32)
MQNVDAALACLRQLAKASAELHRTASQFTKSLDAVDWGGDVRYREMLPLRRRLEMIEQISTALRELTRSGHLFRRVEARALYAEGLTMAELASVFGVSRQRVSALLREAPDGPARRPAR